MTKADLVEEVCEAIGPGVTKKDCAAVVDAFLNAIKRAVSEGEHIEIRGFGTFKVRQRRRRMARNPRTGDPVTVPARAVPVFKPSRLFKEEVGDTHAERKEERLRRKREEGESSSQASFRSFGDDWS